MALKHLLSKKSFNAIGKYMPSIIKAIRKYIPIIGTVDNIADAAKYTARATQAWKESTEQTKRTKILTETLKFKGRLRKTKSLYRKRVVDANHQIRKERKVAKRNYAIIAIISFLFGFLAIYLIQIF